MFIELKVCNIPKTKDSFQIDLRADQALWLANWTKEDGECCLFMLIHGDDKPLMYGLLRYKQDDWREWIQVPRRRFVIDELTITFPLNQQQKVTDWFTNSLRIERAD